MDAPTEDRSRAVKASKPVRSDKKKERKNAIEHGRVLRVSDGYAYVRFERHAACDKCGMCRIDADSVHVVAKVKNTLDAHAGDYVLVDMKMRLVLLSCLIYLVPLMLTVAGLVIGYTYSTLVAVPGAVAGLFLGLAVALPIDLLVFRRKLAPKMKSFFDPDIDSNFTAEHKDKILK